jgi:hypothetical protein
MIELTKTVVSDEKDYVIDSKVTLFPFSLTVFKNKTTIYAIKKAEREMWVNTLKQVIGYSSIYSIYNIMVYFFAKKNVEMFG